ncbi:glycosyltransferase family 9 protein [Aeromonas veronii]|uniref:glycosyltransferase family 9 protein n=1 Tax=Aeromonas TaxID=642 RepID=UPI0029A42E39|nr:lipopolysaccharide heptosyltransferase family protein [Aeromonas veronii]
MLILAGLIPLFMADNQLVDYMKRQVKTLIRYLQKKRDDVRRKIGMLFFDKKITSRRVKKILVMRLDAKWGDSIVSSFFFREAVKSNFDVTVLTVPSLVSLYQDEFLASKVFSLPKRPGYISLYKLAKSIGDVDAVIHLVDRMSMKDMFFIRLLRPGMVFSLDDDLELVNGKMGNVTKNISYANKYAFVLNEIGVNDVDLSYVIPKTTDDSIVPYDVLFNPFGSTKNKSLTVEHANKTLSNLAEKFKNKRFGILSSPGTRNVALLMKPQGMDNVSVVENITTIYDAISHIRCCKTLISVDTALVHIGDGLNKNIIAIFPRNNTEFNPWLPADKPNISILFSDANGSEVDLNNFNINELLRGCEKLLS